MTATVIDGRAMAEQVRLETARRARHFTRRTGHPPGLATVLVGDDPASQVYVANKRKTAEQVGIQDFHRHLRAGSAITEISDQIDELVSDDRVSGILLQLPLPEGIDPYPLLERIPAAKDVDGLTAANQGLLVKRRPGLRPCTPSGVMRLLAGTGVAVEGADAVVVGRSELVGNPIAQLLLHANATVTLAHSRTRDLAAVTRRADILVAAAGVPGLITADHIKRGATVIDVGIHRGADGLVGDVDFQEARAIAGNLTPVPGGVGPMTIAMLLANTVTAAESISQGGLR